MPGLAPTHASSHNALGRLEQKQKHRIPALLALSRCLIVEPDEGQRARTECSEGPYERQRAVRTGANSVTISVDPAMLPAKGDTAHAPDDFKSASVFTFIVRRAPWT